MVGASLAMVGAALQALFRNPLADPFTLGVSGGAALGASIAIAFGLDLVWRACRSSSLRPLPVPASPFFWSIAWLIQEAV